MEKYEPLGVVGEGSYGVVLKCRCRENGRIVAIKKFIDSEDDQNVRKIALREIKILRKLRHENLVNLIEVFRRRKHIYLVFEFIEYTLLDQLEQKSHGLDEETCRKYIFQILRGLGFCHDNNIIHRDVKPENILVSKNGIVKLCDFGFARNINTGDVYTDYVATRWYRAPELLVGDVAYGKEVDIWAIGCLAAEMMTGEPLFPGDSDIDQLFLITRCIGRLAKRHLSIMARNSAFRGFQYPKSRHGSTTSTGTGSSKFNKFDQSLPHSGSKVSVFSIMFPSWPDEAVVFLTLCLEPEPSARPTTAGLLRLPYFVHDNFPTRFLAELNQKLQQEGRAPIKTFSKKQQQRIANVSPSVPLPPKHIQSSHPILRNVSMDDVPPPPPPPSLKLLQSQTANTTTTTTTTSTSSLSLNRQQTFIVDKLPNNGGKVGKPMGLESRIPRKLSEETLLVSSTSHHGGLGSVPPPPTLPSAKTFSMSESQQQQQPPPVPLSQINNYQTTQTPVQHETRRFSMSKKYSEQAEEVIGGGGGGSSSNRATVEGLSMHLNINNNNNSNNNRQLPVTTLTFLGSNMFTTSNAPVRSPNNQVISNLSSSHHSLVGQKKTSPKKTNFYSQSISSSNKPIAFGSSVNKESSFLPRMKVVDDNNSSFPFFALGSPTKPGTSTIRKRDKWGESSSNTLSRKPSTTGVHHHDKIVNERSSEAPSPKNTLPFM